MKSKRELELADINDRRNEFFHDLYVIDKEFYEQQKKKARRFYLCLSLSFLSLFLIGTILILGATRL